MASGLRIMDGTGNVIFDTSDRLTRYDSRYGLSLNSGSTAVVNVPGWSDDGTWAYFCTNLTYQINRSGGSFTITCFQNGSYGELVIFRY